jgi:hypothetical protein
MPRHSVIKAIKGKKERGGGEERERGEEREKGEERVSEIY